MLTATRRTLNRLLEYALIVAVAVLVLDVLWGVVSRYVLGTQSRWTEELATMLLIWVSLLGASVAFSAGQHLGVDYFVSKLHPSAQRLLEAVVRAAVAAFAAVVMLHGGYLLVAETLAAGQVSPALGLKIGYVYLAVPVSGVFILFECLVQLTQSARQWRH